MANKEAEFISQWNGLLDYKIDEQNLRRPNFQFFYNALESLLRNLNFNINAAKSEALGSSEAERMYFVKFCGFIHRLYQLSDSTFNFYYLDLINPTPKKSFHVLKMLFNYLKYYEMVKQTVCEKAEEALTTYNEALTTNNVLQVKNETAKKRAENMDIQLVEYQKKLPQIQDRVNVCLAELQSLDKQIAQKNIDIKNFDSTLLKIEIKQNELSETVVSSEEYKMRITAVEALKQELNELREVAEHVRTSNVGSSAKITELTKIFEIVNKTLSEQNLSHYEDLISFGLKLDIASKEINKEEQKIKELTTKMDTLSKDTERTHAQSLEIEKYTDKIQIDSNTHSEELIRTLSYHQKNIEMANSELIGNRSRIQELEQQQHFILKSILEVLQKISSPFNENLKI